MKTGKLLSNPYPTYHNKNDEKSYIPVTFLKNTGNTGGKLHPQDKSSTRLQELSLKNNTYFGAVRHSLRHEIGPYKKLNFSRIVIIRTRNASSLM